MGEGLLRDESSSPAPVLELAGVTKAFGVNAVLRGIDLQVRAGEVHALLGENGAGKSTLMRILLGLEHADGGTMRLDRALFAPRSPGEARRRGVVMVPQERSLCPDLTVADNIVLGLEPGRVFVDGKEVRHLTGRALRALSAERIDIDARVRGLSVADQQLVEIARALVHGGVVDQEREGARRDATARLLVLDEPTSSLGQDDAVRLFERVRALAANGLAIILVTHFLDDVRTHTHRYTVLRDGKVQGRGDSRATPPEDVVREMLGRELVALQESPRQPATPDGAPILEVSTLAGQTRPQSASFELYRGEVLGVAGLVGSGRTELLRLIAGLDVAAHGKIGAHTAKGVGLLSEDRAGEGLMLGRSIAENITLSPRGGFWCWPRDARLEGARWIEQLAIKAQGPDQSVGELSGGNQQKVQIARLLREDYDVLLVDEPTRGIDVSSKAQVLGLLRELASKGKAIVLVSSQLDELVSTCDRIAVLRRGHLGEARPVGEWSEAKLLLEASS